MEFAFHLDSFIYTCKLRLAICRAILSSDLSVIRLALELAERDYYVSLEVDVNAT